MSKKIKKYNQGIVDLVTDSPIMLTVDEQAEQDFRESRTGGQAYKPGYSDNITISQLMSIESEEKQRAREKSTGSNRVNPITIALVVILLGILLAGLTYLTLKYF